VQQMVANLVGGDDAVSMVAAQRATRAVKKSTTIANNNSQQ
jgi:hypothetical protein